MRTKVSPPATEFGVEGAYHTARMTLDMEGTLLDSGIRRAADKSSAEQLAAAALLAQCEQAALAVLDGQIVEVNETRAQTLKTDNPKGKLLEWGAQHAGATPRFDSKVIAGSWCTSVTVEFGADRFGSDWHRNYNKKVSEHGAAAQVLEKLTSHRPVEPSQPDQSDQASPTPGRNDSANAVSSDPYATLIALKHRRYLSDYGFDHQGSSGPPHAPVFRCAGWALFASGDKMESEAEGRSKKDAQRAAAAALVARIGDSV